jgi:hypothetical protein
MQPLSSSTRVRRAAGATAAAAFPLACIALALADAAGSPAAGQHQYGGPAVTLVAGSGRITFADFPGPGETTVEQFDVSAHRGAGDVPVRGTVVFHSPLVDRPQKLEVTCLVVTGDTALVGGEFREPFQYGPVRIRWGNIAIRDNGPPGRGPGDLADGVFFIDRPREPGFTPCGFSVPPTHPVMHGNFVVSGGS